jgi:hypothetical protein
VAVQLAASQEGLSSMKCNTLRAVNGISAIDLQLLMLNSYSTIVPLL